MSPSLSNDGPFASLISEALCRLCFVLTTLEMKFHFLWSRRLKEMSDGWIGCMVGERERGGGGNENEWHKVGRGAGLIFLSFI